MIDHPSFVRTGQPALAAALRSGALTEFVRLADERLSQSETLATAAHTFLSLIFDASPRSFALVRSYVMVPWSTLPAAYKSFLAARGIGSELTPETPVLALVATRGLEREWNDVAASKNHLCIPLTSPERVRAVPMVASLLTELGLDLNWLRAPRDLFARKLIGGFNGVFHVKDAAVGADADGRLIIPAQDFVSAHGVRTVFGGGGAYYDGTVVVSIFFTRETLTRSEAERFGPLASIFKARTSRLVTSGHIFSETVG
jgi:hypothetical protein